MSVGDVPRSASSGTRIDRIVSALYWPTLGVVAAIVLVAGCAVFGYAPSQAVLFRACAAPAPLCLLLFCLMLADRETRSAIDRYNAGARERWRERTWTERFLEVVGDRRFSCAGKVLTVELVVLGLARPKTGELLLAVMGMWLCVLMSMLTLKHAGAADSET